MQNAKKIGYFHHLYAEIVQFGLILTHFYYLGKLGAKKISWGMPPCGATTVKPSYDLHQALACMGSISILVWLITDVVHF